MFQQHMLAGTQRSTLRITNPTQQTISARKTISGSRSRQSHIIRASQQTKEAMQAHIPGFMRWIERCNNGLAAVASQQFIPLVVQGSSVGYLVPSFIDKLKNYPDVFTIAPDSKTVTLTPPYDTATMEARTEAIATVLSTLKSQGTITGWRNELYPVLESFSDDPLFLIERAAAPHFGIKAYGVHVNGFVTLPDGSKELWVAKRSKTKPTWPGKLDHIVAGGQPYGLSCSENVVKECEEEAGIPRELAIAAKPVGAVSYVSLQEMGLKGDVLFCYDLELPLDFVPAPQDGEVESFMRLPIPEVAALIAGEQDAFKDNCNLVIIDFMIRHGYISPDMAGYLDLVRGLRTGDCN